MKACLVTIVVLAAVIGGLVLAMSFLRPSRSVPTATTVDDRDLYYFNEPRHDAARLDAFRRLISEAHRCDVVRSAVQSQREGWSGSVHTEAVWDVFCSPGLAYKLRFDPDGKLLALEAR